MVKPNSILKVINHRATAREIQRFIRKIHGSHRRAVASETNRVRADAAPNFEHFLAAPAFWLSKPRDMWLDEIFARFHLIEIFSGTNRLIRVAHIAGAGIPILTN